jgi:hypothetical protein
MNTEPSRRVYLVANGDDRPAANQTCWPAQLAMENALNRALASEGWEVCRAHPFKPKAGHGFIDSQKMGRAVFRGIPPESPLIVAEAVWQYSQHLLPGLLSHRGPVLTVANWSGQWPGLVGMLNLNGSLTKAGVHYSTLWSADFTDPFFRNHLREWLVTGRIRHDTSHTVPLQKIRVPSATARLGQHLANRILEEKPILGVFDEGCMGMFNAILPDCALHACGVFKERLSQSALYAETLRVQDSEADTVRRWLEKKGMRFHTGPSHETDLTDAQIRLQCKMYIAAVRMADDSGCEAIGIQYQQGLKDLLPASDLVEGMLNNTSRPPVRSRDGKRILFSGEPLPHFNEVDECAGLDALLTRRVHAALGQPVENTLHDVRWGEDFGGEFVWVFLIRGAAPPAHFEGGWKGAEGHRQPPMYFPNGGSTLRGISRPGEIVWSRIYVENQRLCMHLGRGAAVALPPAETERRWRSTTFQWPILHAVTYGVNRDAFMATHKANHVQVAYASDAASADACLLAKAACARALGIDVTLCGTRTRTRAWPLNKEPTRHGSTR